MSLTQKLCKKGGFEIASKQRWFHWHHQQIIPDLTACLNGKKSLRILVIDMLIVSCLCMHLSFTYQQKLVILGVDQSHFGWILMVYLLSSILFSNLHSVIVKLLKSKRRALFLMKFVAVVGLFTLYFATSLLSMVLGIIFVAGFGLTYYTIALGYCQQFIDSTERSTVISTINIFPFIFLSGINWIVGIITEIDVSLVFLTAGLMLFVWAIFSSTRSVLKIKNESDSLKKAQKTLQKDD